MCGSFAEAMTGYPGLPGLVASMLLPSITMEFGKTNVAPLFNATKPLLICPF